LYLKNLLFSIKLQEEGSVSEYLLQLKDLSDQLFAIEKPIDDEDMVALVKLAILL